MNCFSFPYKRFPVLGTQKWLSFAKTTEQQRKTYINASGTDKKSKNVQASVSKWCVAKTNTAIIHQATIVVPENMHGHVVAAVLSRAQLCFLSNTFCVEFLFWKKGAGEEERINGKSVHCWKICDSFLYILYNNRFFAIFMRLDIFHPNRSYW